MVREAQEPVKVESDEEDGDDTIKVNYKCLENSTSIELRSAIETLMNFTFSMESEEMQRYTMKISALVENELLKNLKQASVKDYFG